MCKYDFIILYEHRQRELENAVLLAMMLEKKGYKVAIEYRKSVRILFQKADVLLTPFLYKDENVMDWTIQPFCHHKKVINMQYEQVFLKKNEEILGDLPSGSAKNAVHLSWGKNTTERYKRVGIQPDHIFEIGHVSLDLNFPKYRSAYLNRKDVSERFNIPADKKWLLFISSFSCVGLTKTEFEIWKSHSVGTEYFSEISYQSQPLILDYFERLAKEHPELVVIYRPHPHEDTCRRLFDLEKMYGNFKVISDCSIRQWILVSDCISTWCSTSLADVFYAQKPCAIIRPIPFEEEYDYKIYRDQRIISDYSGLEEFVNNPDGRYSVNPETIRRYYCNGFKADAFEKLLDVCLQVKNNKKYEYDYFAAAHSSRLYTLLYVLKYHLYKALLALGEFVDYSRFVPEKYRAEVQYAYREMHKYKEEITFYRKRFSGIV